MSDRSQPPGIPGTPTGYCRACAASGVGACDDFPDCPGGTGTRPAPRLVLSAITLSAVQAEATRAHLLHGASSMLGAAVSDDQRLAILTEEVGEVARELNEDRLGNLDGEDDQPGQGADPGGRDGTDLGGAPGGQA